MHVWHGVPHFLAPFQLQNVNGISLHEGGDENGSQRRDCAFKKSYKWPKYKKGWKMIEDLSCEFGTLGY